MADTFFTLLGGSGKLTNDFGSSYPIVLAQLQQTTREQGEALMLKDAEPLHIPTTKGTALFKSCTGSAYNPLTDVKEFGVEYLSLVK